MQIATEARTWIGTPWKHQACLKGIATDCRGVVLGVGKALGLVAPHVEVTGYGREPRPIFMKARLNELFDHVDKSDIRAGDILWLRSGEHAQHLAIYCGPNQGRETMIHAPVGGTVCETPLDADWKHKIVGVWRYKNIDE